MFAEPRAKAELLNSQFCRVFSTKEIEDVPDPGENPIPTIGTLTITASRIEKQLSGLKEDKLKLMAQMESPLVFKGENPGNIKGSY